MQGHWEELVKLGAKHPVTPVSVLLLQGREWAWGGTRAAQHGRSGHGVLSMASRPLAAPSPAQGQL